MMNKNNKKIKILYIMPSLSSGGAEHFLFDLIYNLNEEIFDPYLLLFNGKGFFYPDAIEKGIKIKVLKKRFKLDVFNFYQIYRYVKKIKPDIVHTQLGGDIYGKLAAKLVGIKKIISTEQNVSNSYKKIILFFKKITASFSDKIIAISSAVKKDIILKYKIPVNKVDLIFNGVDIEKFKQEKYIEKKTIKNKDKIIIGSIGRLTPQKNFILLFRALSKIKDYNFECFIVGDGELKEILEKKIVEMNLENKVKLLGTRKDIKEFLAKLDFFVLPSKWEGLGVVLLEAGMAKLPVLASATGGILDIIKNKETGILFKNDNLFDLTQKLNYFFDSKNKNELDFLGENLYNFIIEKFDVKKITKQYEDLYLNLIK